MKLNKYQKPDGSTYLAIIPDNPTDKLIDIIPAFGIYQKQLLNIPIPADTINRRTIEYTFTTMNDIAILEGMLYKNNLQIGDILTIYVDFGIIDITSQDSPINTNLIYVNNQSPFLFNAILLLNNTEYTVLNKIDDNKIQISPNLIETIPAGTPVFQRFYVLKDFEINNIDNNIKIGEESSGQLYFSKKFSLKIILNANPSPERTIKGEISYYVLQV